MFLQCKLYKYHDYYEKDYLFGTSGLITGLVAQAHEKTGEWNGCDRYDFTFKDRQATIVVPKKQPKEIRGSGVRRSSMLFQVWTKRYWKKGSTLFITM